MRRVKQAIPVNKEIIEPNQKLVDVGDFIVEKIGQIKKNVPRELKNNDDIDQFFKDKLSHTVDIEKQLENLVYYCDDKNLDFKIIKTKYGKEYLKNTVKVNGVREIKNITTYNIDNRWVGYEKVPYFIKRAITCYNDNFYNVPVSIKTKPLTINIKFLSDDYDNFAKIDINNYFKYNDSSANEFQKLKIGTNVFLCETFLIFKSVKDIQSFVKKYNLKNVSNLNYIFSSNEEFRIKLLNYIKYSKDKKYEKAQYNIEDNVDIRNYLKYDYSYLLNKYKNSNKVNKLLNLLSTVKFGAELEVSNGYIPDELHNKLNLIDRKSVV
jgi:hypothetical protein